MCWSGFLPKGRLCKGFFVKRWVLWLKNVGLKFWRVTCFHKVAVVERPVGEIFFDNDGSVWCRFYGLLVGLLIAWERRPGKEEMMRTSSVDEAFVKLLLINGRNRRPKFHLGHQSSLEGWIIWSTGWSKCLHVGANIPARTSTRIWRRILALVGSNPRAFLCRWLGINSVVSGLLIGIKYPTTTTTVESSTTTSASIVSATRCVVADPAYVF